ncbi:unnamed protein product [Cuscuta campestris]|uniref:Homeobox domain-containing protein n=1 Tax=Cuscuta campestris TaxID=132261 RepID=A0A484L9M4_9ASTE|nr:unnamed protein product [Cuscuta campestris]
MYTFSFGHVITVPPDDEGWLCPGCDCKVYCVDLLNNLLGTDLSITDSWEKVFQEEAAAAASGKQLDDMETFGIASSDSSDKDCEDNSASKNKRKRSDKSALKSSNQSLVDTTVKNASRTSSKKRKAESLVESECASSSKRNKRLKHGDDVIKRLSESFKENHYPKREVKESLAKELGLTVRQVCVFPL